VRYADDFVVMARYPGDDLQRFVGEKIEGWLGLKINREKTRVVNLRGEGETLDFLGYSFRLDRDLYGRDSKYWNMHLLYWLIPIFPFRIIGFSSRAAKNSAVQGRFARFRLGTFSRVPW